jgi:hypothetical protein
MGFKTKGYISTSRKYQPNSPNFTGTSRPPGNSQVPTSPASMCNARKEIRLQGDFGFVSSFLKELEWGNPDILPLLS